MKGKSAVRTTHRILTELVKEEKLIENKKHIQIHLLSINEHNQFNKFHKLLSNIESLIKSVREGFSGGINYDSNGDLYVDTGTSNVFPSQDDEQFNKLGTALQGLENVYRQTFFLMIQILYSEIEQEFRDNRKDKIILFSKLNYLHASLSLYPWDEKFATDLLNNYAKTIKKYLKDYDRYTYVKDRTGLRDRLLGEIDNFKQEFLVPK